MFVKTVLTNQLLQLDRKTNRKDAQIILNKFKMYVNSDGHRESLLKRELNRFGIRGYWEVYRLGDKTTNRSGETKEHRFPWSPEASKVYFSDGDLSELHLEHVFEVNDMVEDLIDKVRSKEITRVTQLLDYFDNHYSGFNFIVLTAKEHKRFGQSDVKAKMKTLMDENASSEEYIKLYEEVLGSKSSDWISIEEYKAAGRKIGDVDFQIPIKQP